MDDSGNKRKYERLPYNEKILINNSLEATCHDISLGGVFVYTTRALLPGSTVRVTFPQENLHLMATVQVIPSMGGLGLQFHKLDEEHMGQLIKFLKKITSSITIRKDKPTVLLVEDSESVRRLAKAKLSGEGIHVLEAVDGAEALKLVKAHKINAIVLDLNLDKMDGFKLLSYFKSEAAYRDIPVIVYSSRFSSEDQSRVYEAGAEVFLPKMTTSPVKLLATVKSVLRKYAA